MSEGTKLGEYNENTEFVKETFESSNQPSEMIATKLGDVSGLDEALVSDTQSTEPQSESQETTSQETENDDSVDFESIFKEEMEKPLVDYQEGDLITGVVRSVEKGGVLVDINYKSDGFVSNSDLSFDPTFKAESELKPGDDIVVVIEKLETKEGYTILSRKRAEVEKNWESLIQAAKTRNIISVKVGSRVQGGLVISYNGIKGFIPASQVMMDKGDDLENFVGQTLEVIPIQVDRRRRKVICSHKQSQTQLLRENNAQLFEVLEVGEVRNGKVTSIKEFGVFVDIGGAEGLVHISEMSWSRVVKPSDYVAVGDEVDVFVLGVDKESNRISLGMKQLQPDPWVEVSKNYEVGQVVKGTIVRIVPFGAFIRLNDVVEGLIHISELSYDHVKEVSDLVEVGQEVEAKIIKLVPEEQKVGLSLKGLNQDDEAPESSEEAASEVVSESTEVEDTEVAIADETETESSDSTEEDVAADQPQ